MAAGKGRPVTELPDGPPDASGLTPRQQRVREVIRESIEGRGYPPSMREIGERVGLTSSSSVAHQLRTLEEKGFLKRDPNRPRAMQVFSPAEATETGTGDAAVQPMPAATYVPVVGRIAAGGPILAEERIEDVYPLPKSLVGVRQQPTAENGEIVAAMIDGEATVKTLQRKGGKVWLLPHNESYDPID